MQPTNAAFSSLFLEDAPLLSFMASHIPKFFVQPKKEERKKERKWRHHVTLMGGRNRDIMVKAGTSGDATRKCSEG